MKRKEILLPSFRTERTRHSVGESELYISRFGGSETNSVKICSFYRFVIATEFYVQKNREKRGKRKNTRV